jgi:uncharacterized protein
LTVTAPLDPPESRRPARGKSRFSRVPALLALTASLFVAMAAGCGGCKRDPQKSASSQPPVVTISLAGKPFKLEVAASNANRQLGLMYRKELAPDAGMIFVFQKEERLSFWMRNTEIPLDIVYINSAGQVVSIKELKPFDEGAVVSDAPAKYAIELNKGTAAEVGLKVGDTVQLPPQVLSPPDLEP